MTGKFLFLLLSLHLVAGCSRKADVLESAPAPKETITPKIDSMWQAPFQGRWLVRSSSGKPDSGHVFIDMVDDEIVISDDIMLVVHMGERISKKVIPRKEVAAQAFDLEAYEPKWKTWSRVAIMKVEKDELSLCVNFPQGPRPERFEPADDGRECLVATRVTEGEVDGAHVRPHVAGER